MEFRFDVDGTARAIALGDIGKDGRRLLRDGDTSCTADIRRITDNELTVLVDGRSTTVLLVRDKDRWIARIAGREIVVREAEEEGGGRRADAGGRSPDGGLQVRPPMPGKVIKVLVAEGEAVRRNQALVIVEAMKMENEIRSAVDGRVRKVHAAAGDLVDPGRSMIELELEPK
jgi:biotin carboxyl carrier protein